MRKTILLLTVMLFAALAAEAVPAWRGPIKVKQPDGSVITIRMTGDEFGHQCYAFDGTPLEKDSLGFYREATDRSVATAQRHAPRKSPKTTRFQIDGFPTTGEVRCLVILA